MLDFDYYNPPHIVFGKDRLKDILQCSRHMKWERAHKKRKEQV